MACFSLYAFSCIIPPTWGGVCACVCVSYVAGPRTDQQQRSMFASPVIRIFRLRFHITHGMPSSNPAVSTIDAEPHKKKDHGNTVAKSKKCGDPRRSKERRLRERGLEKIVSLPLSAH